ARARGSTRCRWTSTTAARLAARRPRRTSGRLPTALAGVQTLFMRRDAVEAAWRWVMPILDRWSEQTAEPIPTYAAGEWGPEAAERLIQTTGRARAAPQPACTT